MKNKQAGMVLLLCLLICTLISLLIFSNLQNVLLSLQSLNQQRQATELFYTADLALHNLTKQFNPQHALPCLINQRSVNDILNISISPLACQQTNNEIKIWYLIEDLALDPCSLTLSQGKMLSSHRYRIDLLADNNNKHLFLQAVFIVPYMSVSKCDPSYIQTVKPGIQSWRML